MLTTEEFLKFLLTIIVFIIVLKQVIKMITESKELKFNNLSIFRVNKDINNKIKKEMKKCQKK